MQIYFIDMQISVCYNSRDGIKAFRPCGFGASFLDLKLKIGGIFLAKYTRQDIIKLVDENDIHFIRLQFTDTFGTLKNMSITKSQLEKALDNKVMFDGSSIDGFVRIEESDQYLYPDLDTFAVLPWRPQQGKVARLICDVYTPDGQPFEGDPRYVLKRMVKKAASMGYTFNVGAELEFFLFMLGEGGQPTLETHDEAGYFDLGPLDLGENARRDMCIALEGLGFEIEASHHEGAPGQHEIDFKYGDALSAADNIMTFKLVVHAIAKNHGLHATFMPKPKRGVNGSGMHTNMSLMKDGQNAFYDQDGELQLSKTAYHFIAGLLKHIRAITAVTNPVVNSYKRLIPGYEAPCYIAWSARNRSPLIRIPAARGMATRTELRSPDPACNPYLELALVLAAGLDGIENELIPPPAVEANIFGMCEEERCKHGVGSLPSSLKEALFEFSNSDLVKETLGEHIFNNYIKAKTQEWDEYRTQVHDWEIQKYMRTL